MLIQEGGALPWAAGAIHDTVAAVASQAAYQRSMAQSLMSRLMAWVGRLLDEFFDLFRGSGTGRAVTLALVALLVLLIVARMFIAVRASREERSRPRSRVHRGTAADPWAEAQRLAALGRYTEAAHALFAASLLGFAARGEVRLHASKTAGDYVRELRRRGSPREVAFSVFRSRYDRIVYGVGVCNGDEYAALVHDARPLLAHERAA